MDVLRNLEPRFERAGTPIINELDEFGEIIFIQKGIILLGYEINKVRNHCIKMKDRCVIGAYGVTFNQRAVYIYYAHTNVEGFFLRRKVWLDLMEEYDELSTVIRQHVLLDYLMNIRTKMNVLKNKDIQGIIDREDHQTILAVQEKQMNNQRIQMGNLLKENLQGSQNDQNQELDHREHLELIEKKYQEIEE